MAKKTQADGTAAAPSKKIPAPTPKRIGNVIQCYPKPASKK